MVDTILASILLLLLVCTGAAGQPVTAGCNAAAISVDPETVIVVPHGQFDVNITIDPLGLDIYGVEYYLSYDPSIVRAESQVKGPFLGPVSDTVVVINRIDCTNSIISYAETRKVPGGVTEKNISSVIQFTAIGAAGECTGLNLSGVIIVRADTGTVEAVTHNGTVYVTRNMQPVAIGCSKHRINNAKNNFYECFAELCSDSTDPDDDIIHIKWAFGDGGYGTGEGHGDCLCKKHSYISWNWVPFGDPDGHYEPFNASLTVTDNRDPQLEDTAYFDVTVYMAGDANGDGKADITDAICVGISWGDECKDPEACCEYLWDSERSDAADLNNDCVINILDAVIIGMMWGCEAWYPV